MIEILSMLIAAHIAPPAPASKPVAPVAITAEAAARLDTFEARWNQDMAFPLMEMAAVPTRVDAASPPMPPSARSPNPPPPPPAQPRRRAHAHR